ncbi:hypothetical protein TNCV_4062081 [Trichonephila clavipes]|nr:hypothetical protein TNCV_4062081 [Trichonephila clavipes]
MAINMENSRLGGGKKVSGKLFRACMNTSHTLHAEIVEVEIEVVSPSIVPSGNFGELNRTVTCMVLKANDRRTSCPCHDEFRGPRSDYVRQVASENNNNNELLLMLPFTPMATSMARSKYRMSKLQSLYVLKRTPTMEWQLKRCLGSSCVLGQCLYSTYDLEPSDRIFMPFMICP